MTKPPSLSLQTKAMDAIRQMSRTIRKLGILAEAEDKANPNKVSPTWELYRIFKGELIELQARYQEASELVEERKQEHINHVKKEGVRGND